MLRDLNRSAVEWMDKCIDAEATFRRAAGGKRRRDEGEAVECEDVQLGGGDARRQKVARPGRGDRRRGSKRGGSGEGSRSGASGVRASSERVGGDSSGGRADGELGGGVGAARGGALARGGVG